MNLISDKHILAVNEEHKVDIIERHSTRKVKTLEIEYMRYSLVFKNYLFIGTEEKMLYLIDLKSFEILDRIMTASYIFTICRIDDETVCCGEYQGFVDVLRVENRKQLVKI